MLFHLEIVSLSYADTERNGMDDGRLLNCKGPTNKMYTRTTSQYIFLDIFYTGLFVYTRVYILIYYLYYYNYLMRSILVNSFNLNSRIFYIISSLIL